MIKVTPEALPDVLTLVPVVYTDDRGFFLESYNERDFAQAAGFTPRFVQDNHSRSARGVLRGLHYQVRRPQGKLVRVVSGEIFDVAVDVRRDSATFGHWCAVHMDGQKKHLRWVPEGYAHGFLVLSETADVLYKTTDYRVADLERTIAWNDPQLAIAWPLTSTPTLSAKDAAAPGLKGAEPIE